MGKLNYTAIMSLDGYIADVTGDFSWAEPDTEVHGFINAQQRRFGTHLYGRTTYELMTPWENDPELIGSSPVAREFADDWRSVDKIVYSSTLAEPVTKRTRIESSFDPEAVRRLKAEADKDLIIGGPTIAAHAFAAGLVDDCDLYLVPVAVGGGLAALPLGQRLKLELVAERRFAGGTVLASYTVR